ncbi:hypothetical protein CEY16_01150 [Halalkalibacillus sediminis]|uniref:VOC domain-containing protein n=1 Tax=Halalkalibacillus sediminis TaxID=2018042 RepID=A0A2I0QVM1_9BACI|nr:VOC family protein [Halalkalibacillus sediminis]PKR78393.1 hypothetical protein CEY16_01150 [Halalkalibacillus sediminis]
MNAWSYMRIARPTNNLEKMRNFYVEVLDLEKIGEFNHNGYHGLLIGLPDQKVHLELLESEHDLETRAPSEDHLLVFYFETKEEIVQIKEELMAHGYKPVEPLNPYWSDKGYTFEDPEGWRIVFCIDIQRYKEGVTFN